MSEEKRIRLCPRYNGVPVMRHAAHVNRGITGDPGTQRTDTQRRNGRVPNVVESAITVFLATRYPPRDTQPD